MLSICRGTTTRSRSGTRRSRRRCASGDSSTSLPTTIWLPSRRAGAAGGLLRARQPVRPEENSVGDYHDPLDTPLGHHVVMDGTRRIAPTGRSLGLDLSEIKMVYPLVAIPAWIVSRYFYNWAGKAARYLLVPLLVVYAVYKVAAFAISRATGGQASLLFGSYRELPHLHQVFWTPSYSCSILGIFGIFFLVARHAVRKTLRAVSPGGSPHYSPAESSQNSIKAVLAGKERPPMDPAFDPTTADVFVSGHTIYLRSPRPKARW